MAAMRAVGLSGVTARVGLRGDTLVIAGDESGEIEIRPSEVDRMRISAYSSRAQPRPRYDTRIWRHGERTPLAIAPPLDRHGTYGPVMRTFAGWVFADGGQIIRGPGLFGVSVELVVMIGFPGLITLALLNEALASGGVGLWIVTFFSAGLTALLFKALSVSQWPRRVTRPEELDEYLPAREESR